MSQTEMIKGHCEEFMNQPVSVQFQGHPISGVIEHVDDEHVYLLVAVDEQGQYIDYHSLLNQQQDEANRQNRQDGYNRNPYMGPYGAPAYMSYPYWGPRPINWNRLVLPLAALTAIAAIL